MARSPMHVLDLACDHFGGQGELARALGIKSPSISEWRTREAIPADKCGPIELASAGVIRCEDLRPDLEWQRSANGRVVWINEAIAARRCRREKAATRPRAESRRKDCTTPRRIKQRRGT